jgi:hypothetical protein
MARRRRSLMTQWPSGINSAFALIAIALFLAAVIVYAPILAYVFSGSRP